MYDDNCLAHALRNASIGKESSKFAELSDGRIVTYGDLFHGAECIAATLVDQGVTPGDRVAAQVEKSIEALQLYLGTVLAGGVFLPMNIAYTSAEIEYFLGDAEPRVFICDPGKYAALHELEQSVKGLTMLTLGADGSGSLSTAAAAQNAGFEALPRAKDDLAAILYTSGTTGRSKGAMLTHGNLGSNAGVLKDYWSFGKEDVLIHALPIFHTHGLFVAINVTLVAGSSLIFMTKFDTNAIIDAFGRASVMMGVPTFYVRLLEHPQLSKETVANIRLFVSGSAPLLAETHVLWRDMTGHGILERYGMTETNMITSNPYDGERRAGTVGLALPGIEIRVTDPDTAGVLKPGETGGVEVRGPNVFQGYWRMPVKTSEEIRPDGFFITGDLGVIDERGYLSIVGRSKDLIISGGYNIYPKEIETLIDKLKGVNESAVIGVPHKDFGEGVVAVIVRNPGAKIDEATVMDFVKEDMARFKQPKRVYFADELPRNAMGKVQKNILRERYSDSF